MKPMYVAQLAFTTGEVSPDVSSRYDLEQYKSALLLAENAVIRPYGAVARRQGSQFIGTVKYSDKPTRLFEFTAEENRSFLLEVGHKYIRIWRDGIYTGIELSTPFEDAIINSLNCVQSSDVMFICSGKYPIKTLSRYGDGDWRFDTYKLSEQPYSEINTDTNSYVTFNNGNKTINATHDIFTSDMVGMVMQIAHYVPAKHTSAVGEVIHRRNYVSNGDRVRVVDSTEVQNASYQVSAFSTDVEMSWKFTTHGTWTGEVRLEISNNGGQQWKPYRTYTSKDDYNVTDTGKVDTNTQMRVITDIKSGSVNVDLTYLPYINYGVIELAEFVNSKCMRANVLNSLVDGEATYQWKFGAWGRKNGYPRLCTFYQDRFITASTYKNPNYIWMSRTGDYPNFGVEKVSGTITDDSAITLPVINRKMYEIRHIVPANDLLILTNGNEWIVDGSKTITPTNCNLRTQTQRGASECEPQYIGNRCVYVQSRGCVVRDMGYSYESDNYTGQDLTLFVKHLTKFRRFTTSAYAQDPDSIVYYVSDDGTIKCLTYIPEQKVYAWSTFKTNGKYTYAESVSEGEQDSLYVLVNRHLNGTDKVTIERLEPMYNSESGNIFMDCYSRIQSDNSISEINVPHLSGQKVTVVVDGEERPQVTVPSSGLVTVEGKCNDVAVGMSYATRIRIPSVEMQLQDGTLQGRLATVSRVILRMLNSYGGKIGRNFDNMDEITLPPEGLFTGDKSCILPKFLNPWSTDTSISIFHDKPYPFNLLAVTREIEIGGGQPNAPGL